MKPTKVGIAGAAAVVLAIALVSILLTTRLAGKGESRSGQPVSIASRLPAGACPLATDNLPVAESTKMVAKFVTFDVALASDPNFPFKAASAAATGAPAQGFTVASYFWVVAAAGTFHVYLPRAPQGGPDALSFGFLVFYTPADRCNMDGGSSSTGLGAWPAWFDNMPALSSTTIR